jgi:NADH-quinone oxidoreductase subunit G
VAVQAPKASEGFWRVGEMPLYATDALVRRATPLQKTVDGRIAARLSSADAEKLGVDDESQVQVATDGQSRVLPVVIDDALPTGSVVIPVGAQETAGLGPRHGQVELSKI